MPSVRTLRPFYDLLERVDRHEGDVFDATEERAAQIAQLLPGYVEVSTVDLGSLKLAQLRELAAERGVEIPAKATKAEILELLEG